MPFAPWVLDRYIGHKLSEFTSADIPDMSQHDPESSHWLANHFLNCVARGAFELPVGAYAQNFLRRAVAAFREHAVAREATYEFLGRSGHTIDLYAKMLRHWEYFLSQSWQAYALFLDMATELSGERQMAFSKGDGSLDQRLNLLYNAMKHAESRIFDRQIPPDAVTPVWFTNRGIECTDGFLTWFETSEVLRELASSADLLVDPSTTRQKVGARREQKG